MSTIASQMALNNSLIHRSLELVGQYHNQLVPAQETITKVQELIKQISEIVLIHPQPPRENFSQLCVIDSQKIRCAVLTNSLPLFAPISIF